MFSFLFNPNNIVVSLLLVLIFLTLLAFVIPTGSKMENTLENTSVGAPFRDSPSLFGVSWHNSVMHTPETSFLSKTPGFDIPQNGSQTLGVFQDLSSIDRNGVSGAAAYSSITKSYCLFVTMIPLLGSIYLWATFDAIGHNLQMVVTLERLHINFGVDSVSLSLTLLTAGLFPICIMLMRTFKGYITFLLLEIVIYGTLNILDLLGFYILFEASLILLFLLIGRTPFGNIEAAYKIFLYTMAGSLVLLPIIFVLYSLGGSTSLLYLMSNFSSHGDFVCITELCHDTQFRGIVCTTELCHDTQFSGIADGSANTRILLVADLSANTPKLLVAEPFWGSAEPFSVIADFSTPETSFLSKTPGFESTEKGVSWHNSVVHTIDRNEVSVVDKSHYSVKHTLDLLPERQLILGWGLFLVFAVKIPLMPVHLWLPEAHVAAPTAGSVLLAGVLLKLGGIGFIRFMIPILPTFTSSIFPLVCCMCLASFIFSTLSTIRQIDLKKIVAYSSIGHMAMITLAIFSMSEYSAYNATFMMVAHGLVSPCLFLLVGLIYDRYHTKFLLYFTGLGAHMPIFSIFFFICTLANLSFPLFPNFIAEYLCLTSIFSVHSLYAYIFCICQVLGTVASFWALNRIIHGYPTVIANIPGSQSATARYTTVREVRHPPFLGTQPKVASTQKEGNQKHNTKWAGPLSRLENALVLPLIISILWLGVKPMA